MSVCPVPGMPRGAFPQAAPCSREASCATLPPAINRMQAAPGIPYPHTGA